MVNYQDIQDTITNGKTIAISWAAAMIAAENGGEQCSCTELQLVVLTRWIGALETYTEGNYEEDGSIISDPEFGCLTGAEALLLISKINQLKTC